MTLAPGQRIGCGADLHVCVQCRHHDPGAYNECRETNAEPVRDRDRANRCDWFAPGAAPGEGAADEAAGAAFPEETTAVTGPLSRPGDSAAPAI